MWSPRNPRGLINKTNDIVPSLYDGKQQNNDIVPSLYDSKQRHYDGLRTQHRNFEMSAWGALTTVYCGGAVVVLWWPCRMGYRRQFTGVLGAQLYQAITSKPNTACSFYTRRMCMLGTNWNFNFSSSVPQLYSFHIRVTYHEILRSFHIRVTYHEILRSWFLLKGMFEYAWPPYMYFSGQDGNVSSVQRWVSVPRPQKHDTWKLNEGFDYQKFPVCSLHARLGGCCVICGFTRSASWATVVAIWLSKQTYHFLYFVLREPL